MFDLEHESNWGNGRANRWWEGLPLEKKQAYEKVVQECQKQGIQFCFSMNPNLASRRLVNDDSPESVDLLFKHYAWMQGLGVKWFNISLDDATGGVNADTQAKVVNDVFHRLRARDPEAQMIFCPTFYSGDGAATNQTSLGVDQRSYLETLARELDKEVHVFWTGDSVVGKITRRAAESCRSIHNCGRITGGRWYEHHVISGNYRLGEFQGAVLNAQLDRLEMQTRTRDRNGRYLAAKLSRTVPLPIERLDAGGINSFAEKALTNSAAPAEWGDKYRRVVEHWRTTLLTNAEARN
ncbi:MAG: beta-N-acetylglucosaminidase domain-containing protein, partial [Candidatus Omnitrophica bacterium]|nr:beta-N-acetylglucosaminidase domain-containing protein [Candidatus Omnitrophota bacterium]